MWNDYETNENVIKNPDKEFVFVHFQLGRGNRYLIKYVLPINGCRDAFADTGHIYIYEPH